MGKSFTPEIIGSGFNTTNSLNSNFAQIEQALNDALSRSGLHPNAMLALLDMNNHNIINVKELWTDDLYVDGERVPSLEDLQELWKEIQIIIEEFKDFLQQWLDDFFAKINPMPKDISGTYTVDPEADEFRILRATAETTVVLPDSVEAPWYCFVQKLTDETVQFQTSLSVESVDSSVTILEQGGWVSATKTGSGTWALVGNMA